MRLDDTESEIGKDATAPRISRCRCSATRFQAQQAMTAQEAQSLNSTAQALLTTLQQKYAARPDAADYRDRIARLVQERAAAQRLVNRWILKKLGTGPLVSRALDMIFDGPRTITAECAYQPARQGRLHGSCGGQVDSVGRDS